MKLSEIKPGTKILVPCVRCGYKRSLQFQSVAGYKRALSRECRACRAEEIEPNNEALNRSFRRRIGSMPEHEEMD